MKKIFLLSTVSLILVTLISCNNHYKRAEDYYLSQQFELARGELTFIKYSDSDYKKMKLLTKKIDSSLYYTGLQSFLDNNLEKTIEELESIEKNSSFYTQKTKLLKQISIKSDSIKYQQSFEEYSKNNLYESIEFLRNIDENSPYYTQKTKLLKQISIKSDSIKYQQSFEQYSKNHLNSSIELLKSIDKNSPYYTQKTKLLKRISIKKKKNSVNEKYISKAVISSIFGRSPSIMNVKNNKQGMYIVTYGSYSYKVKFKGSKVIWGANDGRWRNDNIHYSEKNNKVIITEIFSDGSMRNDEFTLNQLK